MKTFLSFLFLNLLFFSFSFQAFSCLHAKKNRLMLDGCSHRTCSKCLKAQLRKSYKYERTADFDSSRGVYYFCSSCKESKRLSLEQLQFVFRASLKKLFVEAIKRHSSLDNKIYIPRAIEIFPSLVDKSFQINLYHRLLQATLSSENIREFCPLLNDVVLDVKRAFEHEAQQKKDKSLVRPFLAKASEGAY